MVRRSQESPVQVLTELKLIFILYIFNFCKQIWGVERAPLYSRPWAALSLTTPLCGIILIDWMPNRDILVGWPGRRDKALKTGTVPAKTGRMVSLLLSHMVSTSRRFVNHYLQQFPVTWSWPWFSCKVFQAKRYLLAGSLALNLLILLRTSGKVRLHILL